MSLTIPANAKTKIETRLGTEPLLIVYIEWPSRSYHYAEKIVTFQGQDTKDVILSGGDLDSQLKQQSIGHVSTVSMSFDDTSGELKTIVNEDLIEGSPVTLYHWYEDLDQGEAVVLLEGKITGPISWSEGDRVFNFNIESFSGSGVGQVGFAPTAGSIPNLLDSAIGVPWPMVFGSPRLIPAVLTQRLSPTPEELLDDPNFWILHQKLLIV